MTDTNDDWQELTGGSEYQRVVSALSDYLNKTELQDKDAIGEVLAWALKTAQLGDSTCKRCGHEAIDQPMLFPIGYVIGDAGRQRYLYACRRHDPPAYYSVWWGDMMLNPLPTRWRQ